MLGIGLTARGERLIYLLLFALIVSIMWRDYYIGFLCVFGFGFLFFNFIQLREELRKIGDIVFHPGEVRSSFTAGDRFSESLNLRYIGDCRVELSHSLGGFSPSVLSVGDNVLEYSVVIDHAGEYSVVSLDVNCIDRFGLFKGRSSIPFSASFTVFPRVNAVALEAVEYLERAGVLDFDVGRSRVVGKGLEYADSREYLLGDNLRFIDWKASARLDKLIVKSFYRDASGSVHIIYDIGFSDPVSGDVLAARFLEAVLSFAELGWGIGLSVLNKGEVIFHQVNQSPQAAVAEALRVVFMGDETVFAPLYSLLDPVPRSKLKGIIENVSSVSVSSLNSVKERFVSGSLGGVLFVSCLVGDPVPLLELVEAARGSDVPLVVYEPCTPWKSVDDLERAVMVFDHYERVNRSIASMGVGVAVFLDEAYRSLLESIQISA